MATLQAAGFGGKLFHKAIMQSAAIAMCQSRDENRMVTLEVVKQLGLPAGVVPTVEVSERPTGDPTSSKSNQTEPRVVRHSRLLR